MMEPGSEENAGSSMVTNNVEKIGVEIRVFDLESDSSETESSDCPAYDRSAEAARDLVFSNALVWRELEKCLHFTDLKCLRLVCQDFNQYILEETNFRSRALVDMKAGRIKQEVFIPTTLWKHFRIERFDVNLPDEPWPNIIWIYDLLKRAESLIICTRSDVNGRLVILPALQQLLEAPEELKSLSLDLKTIDGKHNHTFKNLSDKILKAFENLTEFSILQLTNSYLYEEYDEMKFVTTANSLSSTMKNLNVFRVPKFVIMDMEEPEEYNKDGIEHILKIIDENKSHLTALSIEEPRLWFHVSKKSISLLNSPTSPVIFPRLKSLKIAVKHLDCISKTNKLIEFLKAQPYLEELDISVLPKFPTEICTFIGTLSNLKILRVKTRAKGFGEEHTWSFLNQLERLQEFQFVVGKSSRFAIHGADAGSIMLNLPKSTSRICLKGISMINDGADADQRFIIDDLVQLNPLIVTNLNLSDCGGFMTDEAMEWICRNFRMLRNLDVSQNEFLTDFGFTGVRVPGELGAVSESDDEENTDAIDRLPFSIKDLKGLRYLRIMELAITDITLVSAVQFVELVYLDVTNCHEVTTEGCSTVLENNPSLEILKTDVILDEDLLSKFPRIKSLEIQDYEDDSSEDMYDSDEDMPDSDASLYDFHGFDDGSDSDHMGWYTDSDSDDCSGVCTNQ